MNCFENQPRTFQPSILRAAFSLRSATAAFTAQGPSGANDQSAMQGEGGASGSQSQSAAQQRSGVSSRSSSRLETRARWLRRCRTTTRSAPSSIRSSPSAAWSST